MDFTINTYSHLLETMQAHGFLFFTFRDFISESKISSHLKLNEKTGSGIRWCILRHDVDALPEKSLEFAKIQHQMDIRSTYYFRSVPKSFNERIIKEIADMGHEIGYHYETMDSEGSKIKKGELLTDAYEEFCKNLEIFRKICPVETICMHGSPLSKYDNRAIWYKYDYRKLGIIAEPYFDLDFKKTFYLTDTGRCWDGDKYSVRDKPMDQSKNNDDELSNESHSDHIVIFPKFHSTFDIINAIKSCIFPIHTMLTFHPQRWHDNTFDWSKELIFQNVKNVIKRWFYV